MYDKPGQFQYLSPPNHQESSHQPYSYPQQQQQQQQQKDFAPVQGGRSNPNYLPSLSHHNIPPYHHQMEPSHLPQAVYPYEYQQQQQQQQEPFYGAHNQQQTTTNQYSSYTNNSPNMPSTAIPNVNGGNNNSNPANRRGPWSPMEDKKLLELISMYGATNWVRIANTLETRTPKQCRERYHQNLKPSLNRAPITVEEGELIEKLVAQYGKKWAEISRHLNGRSDNAIKNWWNGGANRRRRASLATSTSTNSNSSSSNNNNNGNDAKAYEYNSQQQHQQQQQQQQQHQQQQQQQHEQQPQQSQQYQHSQAEIGGDAKPKTASSLPPPPQPHFTAPPMGVSSSLSSINGVPTSSYQASKLLGTMTATTAAAIGTTHLPQISFNTSMFGGDKQSDHQSLPSINSFANGKSPILPSLLKHHDTRSASFDTGSTAATAALPFTTTTLPPISQSNKRRLIDDPSNFANRRHSSAHSMLMQAHVNGSHSNLAHAYHHSSGYAHSPSQSQSGNVSPAYHGSPLMSGSIGSRNDSVSHLELTNNSNNNSGNVPGVINNTTRGITSSPNTTTNSLPSRRSSSIVSDMAHSSSFGNKNSMDHYNNATHRRNLSQNSSFNSPLLTPSTRFSISSTNSLMNHPLTATTSPVHKHHDFYAKSNRSASVSVSNDVVHEEGEGGRAGDDVKMSDAENEGDNKDMGGDDTTPKFSNAHHTSNGAFSDSKSPESDRKMSVAALLD
ncbi:hypothetical protein CANMA_002024 [Candida margitis]|uniref:uncharacterized protein n=1 Tax=Candida margitis TaxID=1775924 RepID=UPI00222683E5|nr:uncharacterized protein CANMA_002024 [Candida margitis]KAI5968850.1 hypothetical protein CANMA_002024 [Candida margitis]